MAEAPRAKYEEVVGIINAQVRGGGAKLIDWTYCDEGFGIGVEDTYHDAIEISGMPVVVDNVPAGYFIEPLNSAVLKMWEL